MAYQLLNGDRRPHVCPLVLDPSTKRLHRPVEGGPSHSDSQQPLSIVPDSQNEGLPPLGGPEDHDQCPATYQKDSPKSGMRIHIQQIMTDVLKAWM
ncbi:UNVERIFIED_CONTAM: hypothetical protein K2H54_028097 [Gekko kuhli]